MALIPNGIPEKTIERLSEYRRTLLACHREGITHIFFARAGRDSRHYGCASASGSDVDRVLERYQERLRREGADRFYQQHPRQRKSGEYRRNRYGTSGAGHHQIFQREEPEAADHGRVRRRSRKSGYCDRQHSVLPHGVFREGRPGERHLDRHRIFADQSRPPNWSCRSSTPASRAYSTLPRHA